MLGALCFQGALRGSTEMIPLTQAEQDQFLVLGLVLMVVGGYLLNKYAPLGYESRRTRVPLVCPLCQVANPSTNAQCSNCGAVLEDKGSESSIPDGTYEKT
jgi:hypothetical protein